MAYEERTASKVSNYILGRFQPTFYVEISKQIPHLLLNMLLVSNMYYYDMTLILIHSFYVLQRASVPPMSGMLSTARNQSVCHAALVLQGGFTQPR